MSEQQIKKSEGWLPLLKLAGTVLLGWLVVISVYFGKPIKGWVVDAATGKPIEGAVVVVLYDLQGPTHIMGYGTVGHLHEAEAVTDEDGRYRIGFWGPRLGLWGGITPEQPILIVFKDGYEPDVLANHKGEIGGNPFTKRYFLIGSVWNGERLPLKPYRGSKEKYWHMTVPESIVDYHADCRWERLPNYFGALMKAKDRLDRRYFAEALYAEGKCRHPNKVLKTK